MSTGTALISTRQSTTEELRQDSAQLLLELLEMRQQAGYWKAQLQRSKEREALAPTENRGAGGEGQTTGTPTLRQEVGEEESFRDLFGLRRRRETPSRPAGAGFVEKFIPLCARRCSVHKLGSGLDL